ncbi:MAG: hypothetical protein V1816_22485 [Pseudomonadota bacterium]
MPDLNLEAAEKDILHRLAQAGPKGLNKKQLELSPKARKAAFEKLLAAGRMVNQGSKTKPRYVTPEFFRPPREIARDLILAKAKPGTLKGFTRKQLVDKIAVSPKRIADEAVERLVKERMLLAVKCGRSVYYLHAAVVPPFLPEAEKAGPAPAEDKAPADISDQVLRAYQALKDRDGYSDVEIYHLQQAAGVPMDELKAFILMMGRRGLAVPSQGDWSLSSEEVRTGAIELHGRPNLMVRFIGKD